MKIIDAHAHLCHSPRELDRIVESGRIEQVWLMDLGGAQHSFANYASEDEVLQTAKDYPGFFVPFGYLDMTNGPGEVERLKERGFVGLKPYRPSKPWSDHGYFPLYQRACELDMPVLFHTGIVNRSPLGTIAPGLTHGPGNMRPSHLAEIASAFPKLKIIGGHFGYPWLEETAHNLYYYPNIRHDISGYRNCTDWLTKNLDRKCNDGVLPKYYFRDKLLFATDLSYGNPDEHAAIFRMIDFWVLFFEMIGGPYYRWGEPSEREKFFAGNARTFLTEKF